MSEASFQKARQTQGRGFSHRPCLTKDEFVYRIFVVEKPALDRMISQGYPIREILHIWSDATGEAHSMPIFDTDSVEDIVNRYGDLFPKEMYLFMKEIKDQSQVLHNPDGISQDGTLGLKMRMPIGLYRSLVAFDPHFWHHKKNMNQFLRNFPKISNPHRAKGTQ